MLLPENPKRCRLSSWCLSSVWRYWLNGVSDADAVVMFPWRWRFSMMRWVCFKAFKASWLMKSQGWLESDWFNLIWRWAVRAMRDRLLVIASCNCVAVLISRSLLLSSICKCSASRRRRNASCCQRKPHPSNAVSARAIKVDDKALISFQDRVQSISIVWTPQTSTDAIKEVILLLRKHKKPKATSKEYSDVGPESFWSSVSHKSMSKAVPNAIRG